MAYEKKSNPNPEDVIGNRKKDGLYLEVPAKGLKTAHVSGPVKNGYLPLDLIVKSHEEADKERCNEAVIDIQEHIEKKIFGHAELSDYDLELRLHLVKTPGPRRLLEGLRELNYDEWALVMEKLREPVRHAITAYMANPNEYIKERGIELKKARYQRTKMKQD
jgi:hypothetical protein